MEITQVVTNAKVPRRARAARSLAAILVGFALTGSTFGQASKSPLTRLLEAEITRFPARGGIYVKHLKTGEEAGVRADEAFNTLKRDQTRNLGDGLQSGRSERARSERPRRDPARQHTRRLRYIPVS